MDDSKFDKELREKLGEYEAPGFDPTALAALHQQMAAVEVMPWYAIYRTELLVGSTVLLSALLIIWSQWMFSNRSTSAFETEIASLRNQVEDVNNLQREIDQLKGLKPDTVTIVEVREQPSTVYFSLLRKIASLEAELESMFTESSKQNERLLAELKSRDSKNEVIMSDYLKTYIPITNRITPHTGEEVSQRAIATDSPINSEEPEKHLSAKTIKDIQKHYQKGVGVRLGPVASISKGAYDMGSGRLDFGGGLLADVILSPSLSLETGIMHTVKHNKIPAQGNSISNLPGADPSLGELKNLDIDSWIFETPVNLKYRYPISMKASWIAGAGYTPMFYTKQVLEYDYEFDTNQSATVNSTLTDNQLRVYTGTLNLSLGFSKELKNKKLIETSLFYRHGLGQVGLEQVTPNFVGIRGAYWFTVK